MAKATKSATTTESTFIVTKSFRDKSNFKKEHQIGDDVSHFDKTRLEHLVSIGHVDEVKPQAEAEKDPE